MGQGELLYGAWVRWVFRYPIAFKTSCRNIVITPRGADSFNKLWPEGWWTDASYLVSGAASLNSAYDFPGSVAVFMIGY